jgi:hypothetical protein
MVDLVGRLQSRSFDERLPSMLRAVRPNSAQPWARCPGEGSCPPARTAPPRVRSRSVWARGVCQVARIDLSLGNWGVLSKSPGGMQSRRTRNVGKWLGLPAPRGTARSCWSEPGMPCWGRDSPRPGQFDGTGLIVWRSAVPLARFRVMEIGPAPPFSSLANGGLLRRP